MNHLTIGLVGNPNCGKTTLFNVLTGTRQRVGNWPGVTVERKSGFLKKHTHPIEVIDLPGTYSLTMMSEQGSIDERIACDFILNRQADVLVNIIDASHLERSLYLTLQLLEMQVPMVVAVNMMDVAKKQGLTISLSDLSKRLGCPVIPLEAHRGKGIQLLQQVVSQAVAVPPVPAYAYAPSLRKTLSDLADSIKHNTAMSTEWLAMRLLEEDVFVQSLVSPDVIKTIPAYQQIITQSIGEEADILIADARYRLIQEILTTCLQKNTVKPHRSITHYIDRIVLNRWLGVPIFLSVMYTMFLFAINVGGAFQDFFDIASNTLFVGGVEAMLNACHAPVWLTAILANGVGKGISTTVTFIPVIGAMFLFLAFLEDSGYMARAAFVIDRVMRAMGLPGKSFVPMIVGFGCNVPSVMAARTLENKRDRILTIMMSPFMSCGARLAIYAVFVAAFFPQGGQNVIFGLYLIGIMAAMFTGWLLRKTFLQGEPAPLLMELPEYHAPHVKTLFLQAWQRLKSFIFRAGKLIIPICMLLGVLNSLTFSGAINNADGDVNSWLSWLGRAVTPIFAPMGIHQDNWPATVGLLTGILAKEVVVGTLNALYSQLNHMMDLQTSGFSLWGGLQEAVMSIPANLSQLANALKNPWLAQAPIHELSQDVYGTMYQRFDGQIGAMAYLLFVLLYFPCVSTVAAMLRELNKGWAIFSVCWTTGLAYSVAVAFYQLATLTFHPWASLLWVLSLIIVLLVVISIVQYIANQDSRRKRYELVRH